MGGMRETAMVERKRSRKKQEFVSDDVGDQQWGKKNDNKTSAHQAEILRRLVPKRLERSKTMEVEKRKIFWPLPEVESV